MMGDHDLQYNPGFPARRVQENDMFSSPRHFIVILALAAAAAQPAYAQDKNQDKAKDPKVVLDLEKSSPDD